MGSFLGQARKSGTRRAKLKRVVCVESLDRRICLSSVIGGVNLGDLPNYLFYFGNGSQDANWQGASKGFTGDVAVNGQGASERTSGSVPFAGTIYTNDSTLGAWQNIVDQNAGQAFASTGQTARISQLTTQLNSAFTQINGLSATSGFTSRSAASLNGLNTQDGIAQTIVINVTSGFQISSKINITGDANDVFVLRWDTDANAANGYQGQVKFQSGGAIVPHGGLTPSNFIHVAGNLGASGGGSNPAAPYPQGPRLNNGQGNLINNGSNFSGGGFFTGYWLTTGDPISHDTSPLSNAIFAGGWYTLTDKFSMTSGTSGVHVSPPSAPVNKAGLSITETDGSATYTPGGTITYTIVVKNNGTTPAYGAQVVDNLPSIITSAAWTTSTTGGATVALSSGIGSINTTANLPAGATVTFTVVAQIAVNGGAPTNVADFTTLGANNTTLAQNLTLNGIRADAFYLSGTSYLTTNTSLFLRNQTDDHGLGVLSNGESATSGGDANELSNQRNREVMRLQKPTDDRWTSLWVSSLDSNGSGAAERGTLFWSDSPTPNLSTLSNKFTFKFGDFGASEEGNLLALHIPNFDTNAKYLFFIAGPNSAGTNNDYLVWKATTVTPPNLVNTATVSVPGGSIGAYATIGFWHNKNGQAVINNYDSGPNSKLLGNSLATNYPHLFGASNPYTGTSLAGLTNAQVAAAYLNTWTPGGVQKNTYVQAFAVALGAHASTGGAGSFNVGNNGAAFGVPNNTVLPIGQILTAADANFNPSTGLFYGGDSAKTSALNNVLNDINVSGETSGTGIIASLPDYDSSTDTDTPGILAIL
jgi:uncharacterized repeat protein (TIGR01451 family)